jgi:methionyl-tRNA formyltransferase
MRIVYMGTPEFAVSALEAIVAAGHEVLAVFTQPDKAKGRSKALVPMPVKVCAQNHDIPVYQPEKLREEENVRFIESLAPEVIVVAAYGQILPESILNIPKYGCINIHASLLPKYRGAAPIERCIIDGEKVTGVTTMYMEKGLDTGDIIETSALEIAADDTGESLRDKLSGMGAELILSTLEKLELGTAQRTKQDDSKSNYAKMLDKEMGRIDFKNDAVVIERLIRGLIPWPCAYTDISGKNTKIYKAQIRVVDENLKSALLEKTPELTFVPGEIIEVTKKSFTVMCGADALMIKELQPEGKKPMPAAAFLNGNKLSPGTILEL